MLLKSADNKSRRLMLLEDLQRSPALDASQKKWLQEELVRLRKGIQGEQDAAFYLNSYFKDAAHHVLLHDLRFLVDGETAQIDHLIINRGFRIYLIETKNYAGNLLINDRGEFTAEYGQHRLGIPSPIEQSHRHERVLKKLLEQIGITGRTNTQPEFHHVVMLHPKAMIERPPAGIFDTSNVIKADQFPTWPGKFVEKAGFGTVMKAMLNVRSLDTIQTWGEKLVGQHRPADLLALPAFLQPKVRYVKPSETITAKAAQAKGEIPQSGSAVAASSNGEAPPKKLICSHCDARITFAEGKFCWGNAVRFKGLQYCREHQAMH